MSILTGRNSNITVNPIRLHQLRQKHKNLRYNVKETSSIPIHKIRPKDGSYLRQDDHKDTFNVLRSTQAPLVGALDSKLTKF